MQEQCPVCDRHLDFLTSTEYVNLTVKGGIFDGLSILVCNNCGFGFAYPFIDEAKLSAFYSSHYRAENSSHFAPDGGSGAAVFSTRAAAQLLLAKTFRDFKPGESFLDIGPGGSATFITAEELLPGIKCVAVEPDSFCQEALRAAGVEVIEDVFSATPPRKLSGRHFALILMSHVLEHYNAPDLPKVLKNVRDLLADDGVFVCEVPGIGVRQHPGYEDTPHLSFFSESSLKDIFRKNGFEVLFSSCTGLKLEDARLAAKRVAETNSRVTLKRRARELLKAHIPESAYKAVYRAARKYGQALSRATGVKASLYENLSAPDFSYGLDRECIRCVCRKSGSRE